MDNETTAEIEIIKLELQALRLKMGHLERRVNELSSPLELDDRALAAVVADYGDQLPPEKPPRRKGGIR